MRKVLIANRGEIAVRVIRACRDAGPGQRRRLRRLRPGRAARPAGRRGVRAGRRHQRRDVPAHRQADRRGRQRPAPTRCTPATASWPRTPSSPRPCIDAGLTWIGPTPQAIRDLGDKVTARHIAQRVGAPLVPGTAEPVAGAGRGGRVRQGARAAGRHQGGVRRRRPRASRWPVRWRRSRPCSSRRPARRWPRSAAASASSSGTWTSPRHVEAQVLADQHGNVIVVGTRDCSLQRRHQKLVEEAPAPFLTPEQREADPLVGQGDLPRGRLPRRRHGRVPGRRGRHDLVPGGEHPAAGRAPGHRGDLRHRPGPRAVPHRRRREAALHRRSRAARARDRVPHQRRGPGPRLPARARARSPRCGCRRARGTGRHRHRVGLGHRRQLRLAAGQGDRRRRDPAPRRSSAPGGRWTRWWSRAWPPRCRSTA